MNSCWWKPSHLDRCVWKRTIDCRSALFQHWKKLFRCAYDRETNARHESSFDFITETAWQSTSCFNRLLDKHPHCAVLFWEQVQAEKSHRLDLASLPKIRQLKNFLPQDKRLRSQNRRNQKTQIDKCYKINSCCLLFFSRFTNGFHQSFDRTRLVKIF